MSKTTWLDMQERTHAFADRTRSLMKDIGITGRELARRAQLSQPMVSYLLRGRRRPSLASLARIAEALGVTSAWLWGDD